MSSHEVRSTERCGACLSAQRTLAATTHTRTAYDIVMADFAQGLAAVSPLVCWECEAVLKRVLRFRTSARRAQRALLLQYSSTKQNKEYVPDSQLKTLSSLMVSSKTNYDYTFAHIEESAAHTMHIKEESSSFGAVSRMNDVDWLTDVRDDAIDDKIDGETVRGEDSDDELLSNLKNMKVELENDAISAVKAKKKRKRLKEDKAKNSKRSQAEKEKKEWRCRECGLEFATQSKRTYHEKTAHSEPVLCNECGKMFKFKPTLVKHMMLHFGGVPQYPCTVCGKQLSGRSGVRSHMNLVHGPTERRYRCEPCDRSFRTPARHNSHLKWSRRHGGVGTDRHECDTCHRRYRTRARLAEHQSYAHRGVAVHSCHLCGKEIATLTGLQKHIRVVHERVDVPRTHVCEICGDAFKQPALLRQHRLIHTGERPHACTDCGAAFRQHGALYVHRRLRHLKLKRTAH